MSGFQEAITLGNCETNKSFTANRFRDIFALVLVAGLDKYEDIPVRTRTQRAWYSRTSLVGQSRVVVRRCTRAFVPSVRIERKANIQCCRGPQEQQEEERNYSKEDKDAEINSWAYIANHSAHPYYSTSLDSLLQKTRSRLRSFANFRKMSSDGIGPAERAVSSSSDVNAEAAMSNVALEKGGQGAAIQEAATSASKSTVQSSAQASAAETTSTTTPTGVSTPGKPDHLLVLVHGLVGTPQDFGYFQKCIQEERLYSNPKVLVHATRVNTGKTHDGVGAGGVRVAEDIKEILKRPENSDIGKLSIVGFSLGGLYARYAVALLYDPTTKTVAGLEPNVVMTVASPHLGVRSFGWFRFLPPFLQSIAQFLFGLTGTQMMLLDKGFSGQRPLLFEMSRDSHLPFKSALAAFKKRLLYANVQNDFMVPYGTATLQPHLQHLTLQKEYLPPRNATILEDKHLDGCRIWYEQDSHTHAIPALEFHSRLAPTLTPASSLFDSGKSIAGDVISESERNDTAVSVVEDIPESVKRMGEIVTDDEDLHRRPLPVDRLLSVLLERSLDVNTEKVLTKQQDINAAARNSNGTTSGNTKGNGNGDGVNGSKTNLSRVDSLNYPITPMSLEEKMAGSLRELSWKTVCVDFPLLVPIAHNRIVAMGRHPLEEWMNAPGRRAVQHMVDEILGTSKNNV